MDKGHQRIVEKEGVHLLSDGHGELRAMLRRDPVSKKHLFYFVKEGTCDDMAEFIKTEPVREMKKEE